MSESTITPDVRSEIRAAEIAADPLTRMTKLEWCGFEARAGRQRPLLMSAAGWLAHAIIFHEQEQAAAVSMPEATTTER